MLLKCAHPIFVSTLRFGDWTPPGMPSEPGADDAQQLLTVKQRAAAGIAALPPSSHGGYAGLHKQPPLYDAVSARSAAQYPRKVSWRAVPRNFVLGNFLLPSIPP